MAVDLPKIGHISSKLNTFPQKWGHLHRVEIIDLPKVLGIRAGYRLSNKNVRKPTRQPIQAWIYT